MYLLDIPHAARGVNVVGEDADHLLPRRGDDGDRAAVEVELGRVVFVFGLRVEERAFFWFRYPI